MSSGIVEEIDRSEAILSPEIYEAAQCGIEVVAYGEEQRFA